MNAGENKLLKTIVYWSWQQALDKGCFKTGAIFSLHDVTFLQYSSTIHKERLPKNGNIWKRSLAGETLANYGLCDERFFRIMLESWIDFCIKVIRNLW